MIFGQAARFVAAHSSDIAQLERDMPVSHPAACDLTGTTR
jgi:hypothetical protein